MAGTEVLAASRVLLLDLHVRITERDPFHVAAILDVHDRFLASVPRFALTDTAWRVQLDVLATVHSHAPIVLQDASYDLRRMIGLFLDFSGTVNVRGL